LPEIPAIGEFAPGYEAASLFGLGAPTGTEAAIIDKLNHEVAAALADPKVAARFAELGGTTLTLTPAAFAALIAGETGKWAKVIRSANITPE